MPPKPSARSNNPKTALFFLARLPQLLPTSHPSSITVGALRRSTRYEIFTDGAAAVSKDGHLDVLAFTGSAIQRDLETTRTDGRVFFSNSGTASPFGCQ